MKKVIFISALAIAAAVSCTKSDIVDTKFNEAITFENYLGRDAQTKAAVAGADAMQSADIYDGFKVFGFYTGSETYNQTQTPANLMDGVHVTYSTDKSQWVYSPAKYWTNADDRYTFLAYSPASLTSSKEDGEETVNPTVDFTVNSIVKNQVEFLYSNTNKNVTKDNGGAKLTFKHGLSRITVKAFENVGDYDYTIYGVTLAGAFNTTGTFNLADGKWSATSTPATEPYVIKEYKKDENNKPLEGVDVPDTTPVEGQTAKTPHNFAGSDNYLMVIPSGFTTEEATEVEVTLNVTYTTTYAGFESEPMTKPVTFKSKFVQGMAYSLNLEFVPNTDNEIIFTVDVALWDTVNNNNTPEDPSDDTTTETPVTGEIEA